jgi:hypothetical protein
MYIELAAHVGHDVTHSSTKGALALGIAGALIAAVVVVGTGGTALAAIVAAGTYGGVAMDVGGLIDTFSAPSKAGEIITGFPTVLLGPSVKQAARANHPDTIVSCDKVMVAEGSKTVLLGPEGRPMSRRADRTVCKGTISKGLKSLIIGGEKATEGMNASESVPAALTALKVFFGVSGALKSFAKETTIDTARGVAKLAATGLDATGHSDAANLVKAGTLTKPSSAVDWYSAAKTSYKAGASGVNVGAGALGY